jgi:hypothetical protein
MSTDHGSEQVEFLVRCALQSFEDLKVECPLGWTVVQLKQHLQSVCPSKPDPSRQRLIYAGHCLDNGQTLRSVLKKTHDGMAAEGQQVIHLVCPQKDTFAQSSGLRYRHNVAGSAPSVPTSSTSTSGAPNVQPSQAYTPYNFSPMQYPQYMPQNAYEAYWISYQHYMNQMMAMMQQQQAQTTAGFAPMPFMPVNQPGNFFAQNLVNANLPQEVPNMREADAGLNNVGGMRAAAAAADGEQPNDFLDIIYKSIRVGLFLLVLYLYSSVERFLFVLLFVCVMWFVQLRRERNNVRADANQRPANADQQLRDNNNNINDDNNNHLPPEGVNNGAGMRTDQEQSAWNVFWSTVTSFFTSLVPENPVPVNIN